jgi:hypothetical protein
LASAFDVQNPKGDSYLTETIIEPIIFVSYVKHCQDSLSNLRFPIIKEGESNIEHLYVNGLLKFAPAILILVFEG